MTLVSLYLLSLVIVVVLWFLGIGVLLSAAEKKMKAQTQGREELEARLAAVASSLDHIEALTGRLTMEDRAQAREDLKMVLRSMLSVQQSIQVHSEAMDRRIEEVLAEVRRTDRLM